MKTTPPAGAPRAIVVMGVAGSGKTTVARALAAYYGHVFLDADDFHSAEAKARMADGEPLTDAQREPWVDALASELRRLASAGHACVLAFSGLRATHRQRLRESGVPLRFVFLHAAPSVLAARLASRTGHFMPPLLLDSQLEDLQSPVGEPDVIAVDAGLSQTQVLQRVIEVLDGP
jgi:gluconokinase